MFHHFYLPLNLEFPGPFGIGNDLRSSVQTIFLSMKSLSSFTFSLKSIAIRKSKVLLQNQDIDTLENFGKQAAQFGALHIGSSHKLHTIVSDTKKIVVHDAVMPNTVQNLGLLTQHLTKRIEGIKVGSVDETTIRLYLTRNYFERLKTCINDKDIAIEQLNSDNIRRLIDVMLLGTSSERVEGKLYTI